MDTFHLIELGDAYQKKIEKLLLPAPAFVLANYQTEKYICQARGWKSLETRACFITVCINNPQLAEDLERFWKQVLNYIDINFCFLPCIETDKIWSPRNGQRFISK